MKIQVTFYGRLAELANQQDIELAAGTTSNELLLELHSLYPQLKQFTFNLAISKTIIKEDTALKDGDQIALLPPFSGG